MIIKITQLLINTHTNIMTHYRKRDEKIEGSSMCWLMLVALTKCCKNDERS